MAARAAAAAPWVIDLLINEDRDGQWGVTREEWSAPLDDVTWVAVDGIRYQEAPVCCTTRHSGRGMRAPGRRLAADGRRGGGGCTRPCSGCTAPTPVAGLDGRAACTARPWLFVGPDQRIMPVAGAHRLPGEQQNVSSHTSFQPRTSVMESP